MIFRRPTPPALITGVATRAKWNQPNEDVHRIGTLTLGRHSFLYAMVSDGAGGLPNPRLASGAVYEALPELLPERLGRSGWGRCERLRWLCRDLCERVMRCSGGGGATFSLVVVEYPRYWAVVVGDSPVYVTNGYLGIRRICWAERGTVPRSTFLGFPVFDARSASGRLRPKDTLLLCSDGVGNILTQEMLLERIRSASDFTQLPERLIEEARQEALASGGMDDMTAAVLHIPES